MQVHLQKTGGNASLFDIEVTVGHLDLKFLDEFGTAGGRIRADRYEWSYGAFYISIYI